MAALVREAAVIGGPELPAHVDGSNAPIVEG
jgi:hypothetical protein